MSTDDEEYAEIARQYGAKVPFMRSEKTANDFASTEDVLLEVLDEYEKREARVTVGAEEEVEEGVIPLTAADPLKRAIMLLHPYIA